MSGQDQPKCKMWTPCGLDKKQLTDQNWIQVICWCFCPTLFYLSFDGIFLIWDMIKMNVLTELNAMRTLAFGC